MWAVAIVVGSTGRESEEMNNTAVDRAYCWVRERILDGTLTGGSFIDELTVCDATGVSRTPAREAFNRLEGERFITRVPRKGAQVRSISSSDLFDAFHARFMIESFAAGEFCDARRAVPIEMLSSLAIMDELDDFAVIDNTLKYLDADRTFHLALVRTLNNQPIIEFFESLWRHNSWAAITRGQALRSDAWLGRNRSEHHAIANALAAHDRDAASEALKAHLKLSYTDFASIPL